MQRAIFNVNRLLDQRGVQDEVRGRWEQEEEAGLSSSYVSSYYLKSEDQNHFSCRYKKAKAFEELLRKYATQETKPHLVQS